MLIGALEVMNMNNLISVIVPIYNVGEYLERCVNSIIMQSYSNIEIILVDDGSIDNCPEICDRYKNEDSRIKVIHKMNGGLSDARNAGLNISAGEYIAFVDGDDWIQKDMLQILHQKLLQNQAQIASCGIQLVYSDGKKKKYINPKEKNYTRDEAAKEILIGDRIDVSACNKLYSRYIFEDLRYPVGENHEDVAIILQIIRKVERLCTVEYIGYNYFQRNGSISNTKSRANIINMLEHAENICEFVDENFTYLIPYANTYYCDVVISILKNILIEKKYPASKDETQHYFELLKKRLTLQVFMYLKIKRKILYIFMVGMASFMKLGDDSSHNS